MAQAGTVLDFKPDLASAVVAGDVSLDAAFEQAKAIKDSEQRDKILERERDRREKEEAAEEAERNARIIADLTITGSRRPISGNGHIKIRSGAGWKGRIHRHLCP
jgi:hypothetical protein